jgi:ribosomal protein S18 acetylase RimI-like enzyme
VESNPDHEQPVRPAISADARRLGLMLHDFNTEFGDRSPGADFLEGRIAELLEAGGLFGFLGGDGPHGFCLFRVRPTLWRDGNEAYLEELYVVPERRGQGIGAALVQATLERARELDCSRIDLGTSETDTAARALYERFGFSNRERQPDGPSMLFYERDL